MPPQVLYFDLGNVLLSFSHRQMCRQMAAVAGVAEDAVYDALFRSDDAATIQWQYEVGRLDGDAYFHHLCGLLGVWPDRRELELACCDIFTPIVETVQFAERLAAAGHRLAILSNTNDLQWRFVTDGRWPWLSLIGQSGSPFQWAVLSYEVGSMKPDRTIYDAAVAKGRVAAGEVFFTDDREENVVGAMAAGIDAVRFHDTRQLIDDLRQRGVEAA